MSAADPTTAYAARLAGRRRWVRLAAAVSFVLVCLGLAARFGAETPTGRALVLAPLNNLALGSLGRLHIDGVSGDIWRDFTIQRAEIADGQGAWIVLRQLRVRWRWIDLLRLQIHLSRVSAQSITVLRRPTIVGEGGAPSKPPVSVIIDHLDTRLETAPAFSGVEGLFNVGVMLKLYRSGAVNGDVALDSLLRAGDGFRARFAVGPHQRLLIDAWARERSGGALAGALGLPAKQTFTLDAQASGGNDAGQIRLRALTGEQAIATIDGDWNKAGGGGKGALSLAQSTLTTRYSRALGPQVVVSARADGQGRGLYGGEVRVASDNLAVTAQGVVDWRNQTVHGPLHVNAAVRDMARVVAFPSLGTATLEGQLTGSPSAWRLIGRAGGDHIDVDGYDLAHVAGPIDLTLAKRELRLRTTLDGVGGQGHGLLAQSAGAHPKLTADVSRLADGRLLLHAMRADGDGLKLDATGQEGLFGRLSFKGDLRLSNLATSHKGAKGVVDARWSADQGKADAPWALSLDAQADGFASGSGDLDRLLGAKPHLSARGEWSPRDIHLTSADLRGVAGDAHASGGFKDGAGLDVAVKWTTRAPFELGPVAIKGAASGEGKIQGPLDAARVELRADIQHLEPSGYDLSAAHVLVAFTRTPAVLRGQMQLTGVSAWGPARARGDFQLDHDQMAFSNVDAAGAGATATGSITLKALSPAAADLAIGIGPGAFAARGHAEAKFKVADGAADLTLSLRDFAPQNGGPGGGDMLLRNASLYVGRADITAKGPLARLPYSLDGDAVIGGAPTRLKGTGVLAASEQGRVLSFDGSGQFRGADFHTRSPALINFGRDDIAASLNLLLGGGQMTVDARQTGAAVNAKFALVGVNLQTLDADLTGQVSATASLSGRGSALNGSLDAHLDGARGRDSVSKTGLSGDVRAALSGGALTIDALAKGGATGGSAEVKLSLPAEAEAQPFRISINRLQPMSGHFDADADLQPIWDLFFGGDRTLAGRLTGHGDIGGSLAAPRINGDATLIRGRFEDADTGLKLRNLSADMALHDDRLTMRQFSANDSGAGTLTGSGSADLDKGGASTLTVKVHNFKLLDNDIAKATASGNVSVVSDAQGQAKLTGALTIDRADISAVSSRQPAGVVTLDVVERNRPGGDVETGPSTFNSHAPALALDVAITAPGKLYVKGLGLNAEMSLNATVTGSLAEPALSGVARILRGDYDLAGKRFQIDDGGAVRLASKPDKMLLDLTATLDQTTLTAVIKIKGTAAKPEITLTSTPTLPSDEVLSQVLFGQSAAQLSPVEAAQLAATVASLATGGGFDVMGGLRNFARLDRLALNGGDAVNPNNVSISGGKYIGEKVYLELTGGGRQGASAQVEIKANRALSIISQVGGETGAKLGVRWKLDYGKTKKDKKSK